MLQWPCTKPALLMRPSPCHVISLTSGSRTSAVTRARRLLSQCGSSLIMHIVKGALATLQVRQKSGAATAADPAFMQREDAHLWCWSKWCVSTLCSGSSA
jgi:hypothetical protein